MTDVLGLTESEARIRELARQLAETEAALEAVVAGQVDAVADPVTAAPLLLRDAQDALRRSEERYRDLVARSPAIVCELAPDGTTLFTNDALHTMLGFRHTDVVGRNWWRTVVAQPDLPSADAMQTRLASGNMTDHEVVLTTATGERRVLAWNSANRYDQDGSLESIVLFGVDVTERKMAAAQAAQLAAEQAARAHAELAERNAGVLAEASRVLGSSLNYERALGDVAAMLVPAHAEWCAIDLVRDDGCCRTVALRPSGGDLGKWARGLRDEFPLVASERGIEHVLRTREPVFHAPDPEQGAHDAFGVEWVFVVPLCVRDRVLGTIAVAGAGHSLRDDSKRLIEDIALRAAAAVENARLYRKAREARVEAERANQAKSDFLASMSHELRTPLNAIGGYAELLAEGVTGPLTDRQREFLQRILRSKDHLLGLITDVLDFAKIEAGRVEFSIRDVPLAGTLRDIHELILPQAEGKSLRLDVAPCDREIRVRADSDKLRQILLNLLSNAVKFTPPGGRITVECGIRETEVAIVVRDTGVGIAPDKLQAIFEPFVQVGKKATTDGAGLGLAISRDFARSMNGDLTVESRVAEGSAFTLIIPRAANL